ncbi:hypothetical protein [Pelagicoccus sp. SDUM812003]|uniref:hypothetical protein n=1 Tax=Pelagicoccus sp. SDUM812003 TaxID=3041267 RepID=UPI00280DFE90|nr:hypothetical protein [Pelagicoccus sp. SDUM812003]MDQ8203600.1 hypothetical protein [Pelagicoccus sp. SDUM812003]
MNEKIVFLMSHPRHARMWRRAKRVQPHFQQSQVLAFDREISTPAKHGDYVSLGNIANRNYLSRLGSLFKAFRIIRASVKSASAVYCFSLDLLLLAWVACLTSRARPKFAYEVADIRDALVGKGVASAALRFLERFLIRRVAVVAFTSRHFYEGYFREVQRFDSFPHVVIEHKPELPRQIRDSIERPAGLPRPITVGYFGLMKSVASFELLVELAKRSQGAVRVLFRGMFVPPLDEAQCLKTIDEYAELSYGGPYKSPADLPNMYPQVDIVWDAYNETENSRWQRTTRFSESLFFKKPLIVNIGTQDERIARQYNLGLTVDISDPESVVEALLGIREEDYLEWCESFDRLPDSMLYYGDEYSSLVKALKPEGSGLQGSFAVSHAPSHS